MHHTVRDRMPGGTLRLAALAAVAVAVLVGALALLRPPAAAASTCKDTVNWQGAKGKVIADSCHTGIRIIGVCPSEGSIESNTVKAAGDEFGLSTWLSFATACGNDGQLAVPELYFQERGSWDLIKTSWYGSNLGTITRTWTAR
jgi:hypothetical protein